MDLVIDANILASALISTGGKTCDLLFSDNLSLFAPEFLLTEFKTHKQEFFKKSELSENDFNLALSLISSRITFFPFSEFKEFILKAKKICPDIDDIEYFALSLKLNCSIWSNDKQLKKQKHIRIINTSELLK